MSILKELIETAAAGATSAAGVAGFRGHFFGDVKPTKLKKKKKMKTSILHRGPANSPAGFHYVKENSERYQELMKQRNKLMDKAEMYAHQPKMLRNIKYMLSQVDKELDAERQAVKETYTFKNHLITEKDFGDSDFDASDVIAKLKQSAKTAEQRGEDTVAFALEDENGAMVKVWVPDEQADDFQASLEQALSSNDDDEDDENTNLEIAEVLWELRKDFDIVNVEWGDIPEDQEEALPADVEVEGGAEGQMGADGQMGAAGGAEGQMGAAGGAEGEVGAEGEGEMTAEPGEVGMEELGGEESAETALQQVISMMAADAAARKAEAEAKAAEAEAEKAKYAAQAAAAKVKQEEEILDMEAYEKAKKEEEGEAKRLAQLAKYKHQVAGDEGATLSSGDEMSEPPKAATAPDVDVNIEAETPMPEDEEIAKKGFGGDTMLSKADLGDLILRALRGR